MAWMLNTDFWLLNTARAGASCLPPVILTALKYPRAPHPS